MADEAEDVLELENEVEAEEPETEEPDTETDETEPEETEGGEEAYFGFGDEEAAPASESESSVIRDMRQKIREKDRELSELRRSNQPERIEVGEKPTLESCEYDEERFETELDAWKDRKAQASKADQERDERERKEQEAWGKIHQAYEADKATIGIPDFEEAEKEIGSALPEATRALLLRSGKGAQLVAALYASPTKLEELSKLDPVEAAMMVGELRSKLQMKKRTRPAVDRPVRGNAAPANADKELERLEAEADRTGNRSKVIAYKRQLKN